MEQITGSLRRKSAEKHVGGGHINVLQSHMIAASGEFVGTFFFLWMAYSGQLMVLGQVGSVAIVGGTSSETIVLVAIVYGFSLLVNAWAFYRISGGLFNPAVCLCVQWELDAVLKFQHFSEHGAILGCLDQYQGKEKKKIT